MRINQYALYALSVVISCFLQLVRILHNYQKYIAI